MDFTSPRFGRTNSRQSLVASCGCAIVETRNERDKTFSAVELLAKMVRRVFAGNPADAHAIKNTVGRVILLNEDRRVGGAEAVLETFGIAAVAESTHLHGEKSRGGIHSGRKHFHAHRHDAGANGIHFSRGGKREIDDAIVYKRPAVGDSNHRGLAVVHGGDAYHGFEWERAVRRCEFIHVVDLALRSASPVERLAVPGSVSFFRETCRAGSCSGPVR